MTQAAWTVHYLLYAIVKQEGNQTPSVGSGLEYAVKVLKAQYIVVTGHHSCGGIIHLLNSDGAKKQRYECIPLVASVGNLCGQVSTQGRYETPCAKFCQIGGLIMPTEVLRPL